MFEHLNRSKVGWKSDLKPSCATIATVDESYPEAATG